MRKLFIAVARVFGLMQIYYGLAYFMSMVPAICMMRRTFYSEYGDVVGQTLSGSPMVFATAGIVATFVFTFGVAWLLLFRTEWLADKFAVPELDGQPPLSPDAVLHVGARLLGLYVVIQTAPMLVGQLGGVITEVREIVGLSDSIGVGRMERMVLGRVWSGLIAPGLKLAMGLTLVFKTETLLKWMDKAGCRKTVEG